MQYTIAIIGATGNVGREVLSILASRDLAYEQVFAVASSASQGKVVSFGDDKDLIVESLEDFDFKKADIAIFVAGSKVAEQYVPHAKAANTVVIDNSSFYRMDKKVPLIIPEVNIDDLDKYEDKMIIANPNCSTMQMLVALKPLHQEANIKRIVVSTYQSVSGAGKDAMEELYNQTKNRYVFKEDEPKKFSKPIPFNVIPQIGDIEANLHTAEENKMINETKKILGEDIEVVPTCVRVPVFVGHSLAVNLEFEKPISVEKAESLLRKAPGVSLISKNAEIPYHTPRDVAGEDDVYVSRLRLDPTIKHGLNLWIVADNLRKGAALNAVQIVEELIARELV